MSEHMPMGQRIAIAGTAAVAAAGLYVAYPTAHEFGIGVSDSVQSYFSNFHGHIDPAIRQHDLAAEHFARSGEDLLPAGFYGLAAFAVGGYTSSSLFIAWRRSKPTAHQNA